MPDDIVNDKHLKSYAFDFFDFLDFFFLILLPCLIIVLFLIKPDLP